MHECYDSRNSVFEEAENGRTKDFRFISPLHGAGASGAGQACALRTPRRDFHAHLPDDTRLTATVALKSGMQPNEPRNEETPNAGERGCRVGLFAVLPAKHLSRPRVEPAFAHWQG